MDAKSFFKTRIVLTAWYVAILACILLAFSFVLYTSEQREFIRVIVQRDFRGIPPRLLSAVEVNEIHYQLTALRKSFLLNLLAIDGIVVLFGGFLSYLLAGITLSPIQKNVTRQKTFLADVSHEIRTPLAAIQTATEVALRSKNKTKENYQHVLSQVHEETKRLTKMANDLLMLSRMESSIIPVKLHRISLTKIVHDVVDTFIPFAKEKNIILYVETEPQVMIAGDEYTLTQLVMIFLDNALKYTHKNGSITLIVSQKPKPTVVIADTGIGIAAKEKERIFERFYQADSSRSEAGTGLGLAIAQQILETHKAKVSVKSVVGKGSAFTIVFPEQYS